MKKTITWILAITLTCAALAFAGVPQTINYQGYLKNTVSGVPVSGPVNMTFSLYSSAMPRNNPVWREPIKAVVVTNGIYSTTVGSVTNPLTAPFDVPYYLGVKVAADPELAAQPLTSVPYALRSTMADAVASSAIGTSAIADGSVTTPKIANGAVTDAKITGPISAGKLDLSGVLASLTTLQATITTQQTAITQLQTASTLQQATITQQQALIDTLSIQISQLNIPPTVSAGYDIATSPGTLLLLYGKLSDPDLNQTITFSWSIVSRPVGSVAPLKDANRMVALFTPDLPGTYQISLTASDGIATVIRSTTIAITSGMLGRTQLIETDNVSSASSPQIAMDSSGNGVAVWYQYDGIHYNVWANRYSPASGWGTRQLLQTDSSSGATNPQVAMGGSGNAMAVWQQNDGIRDNIWANRYNGSTGLWGTAQLIETENGGNASNPQVATDPNGNAVAVWSQYDGSQYKIWTNRYSIATGLWGAAQTVWTDIAGNPAYSPQVAMSTNGNAVTVWYQYDGTRFNIWANRYIASTGLWGSAQLIETDNVGSAYYPQVASDPSGNAVAVWQQYDGTRYNIWANRFNASSGLWGTAQLIETDTGDANNPQVAMDSNGNAIAVWYQSDGSRYNILANRYNASSGLWGAAQLIETDNAGHAQYPQIAMDSSGNAQAVWYQSDGTRYNIWSNSYSMTSGLWGAAQLIEVDNNTAQNPKLALSASGYALAVWEQSDGVRSNIVSNLLSVGWRPAQMIETDNAGSAQYPQIAIDSSGNAVSIWYQFDGTHTNIWANRYNTSSGLWGAAQLIETDTGDAYGPQVAMGASGNAVAVWYQSDGTRNNIWANRFNAASGLWGTAQMIETDAGNANSPQVTSDPSGNAVVVWQQNDGARYNIWANHYSATSGLWGTAQLIETDNAGSAYYPQVASDSSGNAVAVWQQYDGTRYNIWANRYNAATGLWGAAQLIETDNAGDANSPQVAMDSGGNAVAVWYQYDGTRNNIWANRYNVATGLWGAAQLIETDNAGSALTPQIVMDSGGNALAVWYQFDGSRHNIWVNQYSTFSGWGIAQLLETDNTGYAQNPRVAMNASGMATAVWQQSDGARDNIWAKRFTPGVGWGQAIVVDSDSGGAGVPQVAVSASGEPIVVWQQSDGIRSNIWANRRW